MEPTKRDNDWDLTETLVAWLFVLFVIALAVSGLPSKYNKDKSDKLYYKDGNAIFVEAKCLLGSLFNKDVIILTDDNVIITSSSFFSTKKTTYPYSMLKEVIFSKSEWLNRYKIVIKYPSSFFVPDSTAFYFNQEDTFNTLRNQFHAKSKNRCIISDYF
jgi:hypothetical protein